MFWARRVFTGVRGVDRVRVDELAGVVLFVGIELRVWLGSSVRDQAAAAVVGVVLSVGVAVRRRWPLAAILVSVSAVCALTAVGGRLQHAPAVLLAVILIVYGVGAFLPGRRAWLALVVAMLGGAIIRVAESGWAASDLLFLEIFVVLLPWALGRMLRERAARERAYRETAERLDARREQSARLAGFGERARIARELHDVIAHSVSLMVVHAGGARLVMGSDPEHAEASLRRVERAGGDALVEMRRLVGVLDGRSDPWSTASWAGLADLEELLARARASGLATDLRVEGEPAALSPGLDQCAYRIVQEALTNVIKHADAASTQVRVRWGESALELEISDDGHGPGVAAGHSGGHGIAGMRERAALHGGSIHADADATGGFTVRACLPLAHTDRARRGFRERIVDLDRARVDAIMTVTVIIAIELEQWLSDTITAPHRLVTAIAAVFFAAPIAFRRRSPSLALLFCVSVVAIQTLLGGELISNVTVGYLVPLLVLGYSAGAWLDSRASVVTLVLAVGILVVSAFLPGDGAGPTGIGEVASGLFYLSMMIVPGWFVGRLARERHRRATAFSELAAQAAVEQDERESASISAERARIGGELQNIIARRLSAMVLQAIDAIGLLRSDPDRARELILSVEHTGREALGDLRRLLGILRKDDDPTLLTPQPGLEQLAALVSSMREVGVECELRTVGEQVDLMPGLDLVGFRVIEAALRTAVGHNASHTVATVRYEPHELEVEVRGDSTINDLDELLRGVSQRVALYDGTLRVLPAGGDGFALQARLPLGAALPA